MLFVPVLFTSIKLQSNKHLLCYNAMYIIGVDQTKFFSDILLHSYLKVVSDLSDLQTLKMMAFLFKSPSPHMRHVQKLAQAFLKTITKQYAIKLDPGRVKLLRASERSERSEHTVVLSLRFYYIYIYSVTKILRKIRATTFTENYGKLRERGISAWYERTLLPISLDNAILYPFATSLNSTVDTTQTSKTFLFWFTRSKPLQLFLRRLLDT